MPDIPRWIPAALFAGGVVLDQSSTPETGGEYATRSLGVIRAGIISAREGRRVQLAEVLADPKA